MTTPAFYYSNLSVSNTTGVAISNSATSVYCASAPVGFPAQFPFKLVLGGAEIVSVTAGSGTAGTPWTITRAQDGTAAQAWALGTTLVHELTAGDLSLSRTHEIAVQAQLPHGLPATAWVASAFATLNETTLANSTSNLVTWSSIPQTYKHLLVVIAARLTETTVQSDDILMQVNGDASAVYSYLTISATNISGSGTAALSQSQFAGTASTVWPIARVSASLAGSAVTVGGGFAVLPNYSASAFNKSFYGISGMGQGSGAAIDGRWRIGFYNPATQAAITSLSCAAPAGSNFLLGSQFSLYGFG
jgi:hypothetical protein